MPYDPRIQDISGQILAQGMVERSRGISAGIENFIKGYEQNQALKKQAMATFSGVAAADPEFLKFLNSVQQGEAEGNPNAPKVPPEVLKAYARGLKGDVDLYDASILGNFASVYQKTKSEAQQRQLQEAQMSHINQQNALLGQQIEQSKRQSDFFRSLQDGAGAPINQPSQAPLPYYLARPGTAMPVQAATQQAQPTAMSPQELQKANLQSFLSTPQQSAATPPAGLAGFMGAQPNALSGRPTGVATKADFVEAARNNPGANMNELTKAAQKVAEDRLKAFMGEAVFTGPQGRERAQQEVDQLNQTGKAPAGMMWAVDFSESAKGFYPKLREKPMSAEEQVALATNKARGEMSAKAQIQESERLVNDINSSAAAAIDDNVRLKRIRQLYSQKAESGKLAAWTLDARTALAEAGLGDKAKTAGEQELRALLARSSLQASRNYYKGQGSTSNEERARIDQIIEAYDKGQISNEALMQFAEAHNRKLIAASQLDSKLRKSKATIEQRGEALQDWWINNPIDKYMGDGVTEEYDFSPDGTLVKSNRAKPAATQSPATAQPVGNIGRFKVLDVK